MTIMSVAMADIQNQESRVKELEELVEKISRGKIQWEVTFDVISDPVVIIDDSFQIRRANKAMAKACQQNVKDIIGKRCHEVFAGYESPCAQCPVPETNEESQSKGVELKPFPKGRSQYQANAYKMPKDDSGEKTEYVLHYRNITGEKELQKQLMQTDKMAAIGTLAGGIAHEINNPLGAILAHVQLVGAELAEDHPSQESIKEAEESVLRCTKIVRDLLDFSRKSFDEQMELVEFNQVLEKTMALINVNAKYSHIQIEKKYESDLPRIYGHFHKLQQVMLNLVTNAMHSMKGNGGTLTIETYANSNTQMVGAIVEDTGHGIDEEDLRNIFNPFFTTKDQGEGTGLGLSISYNIIREHEGKIEVQSEVGKGTKFVVEFPMTKNT